MLNWDKAMEVLAVLVKVKIMFASRPADWIGTLAPSGMVTKPVGVWAVIRSDWPQTHEVPNSNRAIVTNEAS